MNDFDKLRQLNDNIYHQGDIIAKELKNISNISFQLADRFAHVGDMLTEIDKDFSKATSIVNKKDLIFLFVATGLLCAKWLIMGQIAPLDFDFKHNLNLEDRDDHDEISDKIDNDKSKDNADKDDSKYRTMDNILFGSVPYDAMNLVEGGALTIPGTDIKLYSKNHHAYTMGHDPVLGWIFGTVNILSRSVTLKHPFPFTYNVVEKGNRIGSLSTLGSKFSESLGSIKENTKRLPAAVMRHGLHLASDKFCHTGLPIPFLSAEKAQELIMQGWNSVELSKAIKKIMTKFGKNLAIVGVQFIISLIINEIIKAIHLMMYDEKKDGDIRLYQVRTRKILLTSNCISSFSNLIFSFGVGYFASPIEGAKRLDIGGFIETIHRLVVDTKFIDEVKREYIKENLKSKILETDFDLIYGNNQYGGME